MGIVDYEDLEFMPNRHFVGYLRNVLEILVREVAARDMQQPVVPRTRAWVRLTDPDTSHQAAEELNEEVLLLGLYGDIATRIIMLNNGLTHRMMQAVFQRLCECVGVEKWVYDGEMHKTVSALIKHAECPIVRGPRRLNRDTGKSAYTWHYGEDRLEAWKQTPDGIDAIDNERRITARKEAERRRKEQAALDRERSLGTADGEGEQPQAVLGVPWPPTRNNGESN